MVGAGSFTTRPRQRRAGAGTAAPAPHDGLPATWCRHMTARTPENGQPRGRRSGSGGFVRTPIASTVVRLTTNCISVWVVWLRGRPAVGFRHGGARRSRALPSARSRSTPRTAPRRRLAQRYGCSTKHSPSTSLASSSLPPAGGGRRRALPPPGGDVAVDKSRRKTAPPTTAERSGTALRSRGRERIVYASFGVMDAIERFPGRRRDSTSTRYYVELYRQ